MREICNSFISMLRKATRIAWPASLRDEAALLPRETRDFYELADDVVFGRMPMEEALAAVARYAPELEFQNGRAEGAFWQQVFRDARALTSARRSRGKLRSLWGVSPIVSIKYSAKADRLAGIEAETFVFHTYYITSDFDHNLNALQTFITERQSQHYYTLRKFVLAWALLRYDIFHLFNDRGLIEPNAGYGSTVFGIALGEMQAYRDAGKTFFSYAFGADYRLRNQTLALGEPNMCMDCPEPRRFCVCDDENGRRVLETIASYTTRMIGFGLSMDYLVDPYFLPYATIDMDDPDLVRASADQAPIPKENATFRVGHFTNHGFFKGTRYLEKAVQDLQAEGKRIELVHFVMRPRDEVLQTMRSVDVVVDQLIGGSFGFTATEAMAVGAPVIAYLRPGVAISAPDECPIINASSSTIKTVLAELMGERKRLERAAREGPTYVRKYLSIQSLSADLRRLYQAHGILIPQPLQAK
jgi:hypothetical protein